MLRIEPELIYIKGNCYKYTFDNKRVKSYAICNCIGKTLNLFAGKNILEGVDEFRVDSDPTMPNLNFVGDANDFLKQDINFDTVIWDPPWNQRKSKEFYEGRYIGQFTKLKNRVSEITNKRIISLGYEITNFGVRRGFILTKLFIIDSSGEIRPYFMSIEDKIND